MRVAVSKEGAEQFELLARQLETACDEIQDAAVALKCQFDSLSQEESEIFQMMLDMVNEVLQTLGSSREDINVLIRKCRRLSEDILTILEFDIGGSGASTGESLNTGRSEAAGPQEDRLGKETTDDYGERIFWEYQQGFGRSIVQEKNPGNGNMVWVSASDIVGVRAYDDIGDQAFWSHHGNSKEMYAQLAGKIPEVKALMDQGLSLDAIKEIDDLRACAEQFFTEDNAVRVTKYKDKYIFYGDGRHRVEISKELGLRIPVLVVSTARQKNN